MILGQPFIDKRFPGIPEDHFVLDLRDPVGRACARLFCALTEDAEMKEEIELRAAFLDKRNATVESITTEKKIREDKKERYETIRKTLEKLR